MEFYFLTNNYQFMRIYHLLLLMGCCSLLTTAKANSASFVLSGTVVNEKGDPMPGANLRVIATMKGATTDVYGKFLLEVEDESDSIAVTFVGYKTQTFRVGSR